MTRLTIMFLALIISQTALADSEIKQLNVVPNTWKLENYTGDLVVVWFSGSTCANGRLSFPSTATIDDKNRFWSTLLASRATNSKMFVRYTNTPNCDIVSFGVSE